MAFRRAVLEEVGGYDTACLSGEDQDLCMRISRTGWRMFFQGSATVGHRCRQTIRSFLRQWHHYGRYHPYVFRKHHPDVSVLYVKRRRTRDGSVYSRWIWKTGVRIPVVVFLNVFLLIQVSLLLALVAAALGWYISALTAGGVTLGLAAYYFRTDVVVRHPWTSLKFMGLRYGANLALLIGGLCGGWKAGMLYLSGTLDYGMKTPTRS